MYLKSSRLTHKETIAKFKEIDRLKKSANTDRITQLKKEIAEGNYYLVEVNTRKYARRWPRLREDDILSAAHLGLMVAINGFKYKRGLAFSTYAPTVIVQKIKKCFEDHLILKSSVYWRLRQYRLASERLLTIGIQNPSLEEVNKMLVAMGRKKMSQRLFRNMQKYASLSVQVDIPQLLSPEDINDNREQIDKMLRYVPERHQNVLKLYFGVDNEEHNHDEIGKLMQITGERSRQIVKEAVKKIRSKITIAHQRGETGGFYRAQLESA